ncbi:MAG: hypothetical protein ACHQ0J_04880 [Candidatus Dormibacterales bacterium]
MKWKPIVSANPWLVPALSVVGILVATITGGPVWGLFELYMLLFLGLVAFELSRRARGARGGSTVRPVPFQPTGQFRSEPWDNSGRVATESSGEVKLRVLGEPAPLDPYPILAAFVAAIGSDPERVRVALEPWIKEVDDPDRQKEREAQLHYWLFRAGIESELETLREMAAADPDLAEVVLYFRLAVQDTGETWS